MRILEEPAREIKEDKEKGEGNKDFSSNYFNNSMLTHISCTVNNKSGPTTPLKSQSKFA